MDDSEDVIPGPVTRKHLDQMRGVDLLQAISNLREYRERWPKENDAHLILLHNPLTIGAAASLLRIATGK